MTVDDGDFKLLMERVRAGDSSAANELFQRYERLVRREIRVHLTDPRLKRLYDTVDFSQSVMASFFFRASNGSFELEKPSDLIVLLLTMARNKIASGSRKLLSQKRESKRSFIDAQDYENHADNVDTPSKIVSLIELIDQAKNGLTEDERHIHSLRSEGRSWDEIAKELGGTPQSRRMQLSRALDRIADQFDLRADDESS